MRTLTRPKSAAMTWGLVLTSLAFLFPAAAAQEDTGGLRVVAVNLTDQEDGRTAEEGADAPVSRPGDVIEYR